MAGGMSGKRGSYSTVADRVADTRGHTTPNGQRPPGLTVTERREQATYRTTEPCHVTILTETGCVPGLLVEWRKPLELPWEGHVWLMRLVEGRWATVDQWLPAGAIEKASS